MKKLQEYTKDEKVCAEYERAFLLNIFTQMCDMIKKDKNYKRQIMRMLRESPNFSYTFGLFIEREFDVELSDAEINLICTWMRANLAKMTSRKEIPKSEKERLYVQQGGKCAICQKELGDDWSKIHVDHIIPWDYVGDELAYNYQDLCETCNFEKGNNITYTFLSYLGLCKRRKNN